jgi:hypothetical protein
LIEAASGMEILRSSPAVSHFAAILITLLLAVPAMSVELFRYHTRPIDLSVRAQKKVVGMAL